jgi:hypothetical protein
MPRLYTDEPGDRYILEEEGDVTEVNFIMSGTWAIAFNSFDTSEDKNQSLDDINTIDKEDIRPDMLKRGILIAEKRVGCSYIGDYYALAHKRSEFHFVALSRVHTFSITKRFLFKTLFKKFPELHMMMLSDAFARYIGEFRRPCGKKRFEAI